jgi:hypothetical protein
MGLKAFGSSLAWLELSELLALSSAGRSNESGSKKS